MEIFVKAIQDSTKELKQIQCDEMGYKILKDKTKVFGFYIYGLKTPAAQILKQESLACGGDFALPKDAILYKQESYNGILMVTKSQSKALLKKLKIQPFGLKEVAKSLEEHLNLVDFPTQIMGIINATPDSFYQDSRKDSKEAQERILEMIQEGIDIIDIGGASTKPGSAWITEQEEMNRIKPIVEFIAANALYQKVKFSIDTYTPKVARYCLENGFGMVNDITGFSNPKMLEAVCGYDCECVVMHMQGNPKEMQKNPQYENLFLEIDSFFKERIEALRKCNIQKIILDVGIGFGKTLEHNCELIKNLRHFKHFGMPLLVGASRKSMIDKIVSTKVEERLAGTLAIHLEALKNGANIIRCHDTKEHIQATKVWGALQ